MRRRTAAASEGRAGERGWRQQARAAGLGGERGRRQRQQARWPSPFPRSLTGLLILTRHACLLTSSPVSSLSLSPCWFIHLLACLSSLTHLLAGLPPRSPVSFIAGSPVLLPACPSPHPCLPVFSPARLSCGWVGWQTRRKEAAASEGGSEQGWWQASGRQQQARRRVAVTEGERGPVKAAAVARASEGGSSERGWWQQQARQTVVASDGEGGSNSQQQPRAVAASEQARMGASVHGQPLAMG